MRVAFVGGAKFDTTALDTFLWKLREKHPGATIVTGNGRGAERHVHDSATALGFKLERPELHPEWFGTAAMDCQVADILTGTDIIVMVGTGGRVKIAWEWIHRMNMHQRDVRGGLVKNSGHYVSLRTPGTELKFFHVAEPKTRQVAKAA